MRHRRQVSDDRNARDILTKSGVKLMEGGHISGLNGLALSFAEKRNIEAVCLLATMPQYAISLPNPKASLAIIETLQKIIGFKLEVSELNEYIRDTDEKMAVIEDKVKDVMSIETKESDPGPAHPKKAVPSYIMDKIEKLFAEAAADKSKAMLLKTELDRWDLYKMYEDRFLDLFKANQ